MKTWIAAFLAAVMLLPAVPAFAKDASTPFEGLGERFTVQKINREAVDLYDAGLHISDAFFQSTGLTPGKFLENFQVSPYREGLARVYVREIEKFGFIGQDGDWSIRPRFDFASDFEDGLALVTYRGKEMIIDSKGNFVYEIPEGFHASGFCGGVTALLGNGAEEGDNLLFLDSNLQETYRTRIDFNFYYMIYNQFADGLFSIVEIDKDTAAVNQRFVDKTGQTKVTAPQGAVFNSFRHGIAYGQYDGDPTFYRLDTAGNIEKTALTQDQSVDFNGDAPYLSVLSDTGITICDYATLEPLFTAPANIMYFGTPHSGFLLFVELDEEGGFTDTCYVVTDTKFQPDDQTMPETSFPSIGFPESYTVAALKIGDSRLYMNGETTLMDTPARIQEERTFIPVRFLAEKLGYWIWYDDETKEITFQNNDRKIRMTVGGTDVNIEAVNLETLRREATTITMDVAPFIDGDRTMIPARYLAELTGYPTAFVDNMVIMTNRPDPAYGELAAEIASAYAPSAMTLAEYPKVDGSTATLPLSYALAERMLGVTNAQDFISHTKTTNSYKRLINKEVDMLITGTPVQSILNMAQEAGVEFEVYNLAKEGFVFLLNADNPIDNLTEAQIQDIYQGKLTNWKEAGGKDGEIIAYQRNEGAGSQNLMKSLVMRDKPMMEAKTEKVIDAMAGIVDIVADYDNSENSIGYSVYYYFTEMHNKETVKLPAVNGIKPTPETISSGKYPYTLDYCIVIRKDEPADSAARKLIAFLQTEEGKQLVADAGFINTAQ